MSTVACHRTECGRPADIKVGDFLLLCARHWSVAPEVNR